MEGCINVLCKWASGSDGFCRPKAAAMPDERVRGRTPSGPWLARVMPSPPDPPNSNGHCVLPNVCCIKGLVVSCWDWLGDCVQVIRCSLTKLGLTETS